MMARGIRSPFAVRRSSFGGVSGSQGSGQPWSSVRPFILGTLMAVAEAGEASGRQAERLISSSTGKTRPVQAGEVHLHTPLFAPKPLHSRTRNS